MGLGTKNAAGGAWEGHSKCRRSTGVERSTAFFSLAGFCLGGVRLSREGH